MAVGSKLAYKFKYKVGETVMMKSAPEIMFTVKSHCRIYGVHYYVFETPEDTPDVHGMRAHVEKDYISVTKAAKALFYKDRKGVK